MRTVALVDESRRSWADSSLPRPVAVTVWAPAGPGPFPVTMLSHGTGGRALDLAWLAEALVDAGHIVVGIDHHGNTSTQEYLPEGFAFFWERARDVSLAVDWALAELEVDPSRVSAAGFSLGGNTCALLAGARVDADALTAIMNGDVPMPPLPEMPDLVERLSHRYPAPTLASLFAHAGDDVADARLGRVAMIAPSLGELVTDESLRSVQVPALVLWGEADAEAEPEHNARRYASLMPGAVGRSMGEDVEHYWWWGDHPSGVELRAAGADAVVSFLAG